MYDPPSLVEQLRDRLTRAAAAPSSAATSIEPSPPSWSAAVPDAHGTVVLRVGDRLAVRLDEDVPLPRRVGMAILADAVYKGELVVAEVWRGHALGRFVRVAENDVAIGDRASCRMP